MAKTQLILASQSPQRMQILRNLGIDFKAIPAHIDEHHSGFRKPHAIAKSIALRKAESIAKRHPDKWILGCDTIVVLSNGKIAVKPKKRTDAEKTIRSYQNSHCDVYSGLALINKASDKSFVGYEKTRIRFINFADDQIQQYLNSGKWRDRSGSLTIEDSKEWIKSVEGDYWNVVGLPVNLLKKFLQS